MWWKLSAIISCGTLAGAIIPSWSRCSPRSIPVTSARVVTASREVASLNILAGLTAGNFSAYWMGLTIAGLMAAAYAVSSSVGVADLLFNTNQAAGLPMTSFACGARARCSRSPGRVRLLGMGPVTIAVRLVWPGHRQRAVGLRAVPDRDRPGRGRRDREGVQVQPDFAKAKSYLEENDGAGNTFKATAKPVLIGTAVVGAATMIFALIMLVTTACSPSWSATCR